VARGRTQRTATVGVTEHGNSAVLVTVASDGELLDRHRIDLTDSELPTHPHHHEGSRAVRRSIGPPWQAKHKLAAAAALAATQEPTRWTTASGR